MRSKDDYISHISRINYDRQQRMHEASLSRRTSSQQVLNLYRFILNAVNSGLVIYEDNVKWFVVNPATWTKEPIDEIMVNILLKSVSQQDLAKLNLVHDKSTILRDSLLNGFDFSIFLDKEILDWFSLKLAFKLKSFKISSLIPTSKEARDLLLLVYSKVNFNIDTSPVDGSAYFSIFDYSNKSLEFLMVPKMEVQDLFLFSIKNNKYSII